jgi:hypothetical protein
MPVCIDERLVNEQGWRKTKIRQPIPMRIADGWVIKKNTARFMDSWILEVGGQWSWYDLLITWLSMPENYLGYEWLERENLVIDWRNGAISWQNPWSKDQALEKQQILDLQQVETEPGMDTKRMWERRYPEVFTTKAFEKLPKWWKWDHQITLMEGSKLPWGWVYQLSRPEKQEMKKFIEENLESGHIWPLQSPYTSPFFFWPKLGTSKLQGIQDYQELNKIMVKDRYPLPLISLVLEKLSAARWFLKMGLWWGFNNIWIMEGNEAKAAFIMKIGSFEPMVMQFGLCSTPATFQRMMDEVLALEKRTGKVEVYMDDILIFTDTQEENQLITEQVIRRLREHGLCSQLQKCKFEVQKVTFLRQVMENGTVQMSEEKVKKAQSWRMPWNKKELRCFLRFMNTYQKFIRGYVGITKPLHVLTCDAPWNWTDKCTSAFNRLCEVIRTQQVLGLPLDYGRYQLKTDTSEWTTGAVLSQQQEDRKFWPTSFDSKLMKLYEWNYNTYDKELLAIMKALEEYRGLLIRAEEPF